MFNVTFYGFAKKVNSTLRPGEQAIYKTYNCELKAPTSIIAPTLIINDRITPSPSGLNYCYIPAFERYYFIDNWNWVNGLWECSCTTDVLATFKTTIGLSTQYIERASDSSIWNGSLVDNVYPCLASETSTGGDIPRLFERGDSTGLYVVGIINNLDSASIGTITYYVMTASQVTNMKSYLMSNEAIDYITSDVESLDISKTLLKTLYNPFQYIVSCKWFPFSPSAVPQSETVIDFGYWTMVGHYAYARTAGVVTSTASVTLPANSQASTYGDFMNKSPYTKYSLIIPPYGQFAIPPEILKSGRTVSLTSAVDLITGIGTLTVASSTYTILTSTAQIGVDVALSQISTGFSGQVASLVKQAVPGITGGSNNAPANTGAGILDKISGGIGSLTSGIVSPFENLLNTIADSITANDTQVTTLGTNGNRGTYNIQPRYSASFKSLATHNDSDFGRPVGGNYKIENIPGFIKCGHAHIETNATKSELLAVEAFMESGFYYE